jgi:hypothetical protein
VGVGGFVWVVRGWGGVCIEMLRLRLERVREMAGREFVSDLGLAKYQTVAFILGYYSAGFS